MSFNSSINYRDLSLFGLPLTTSGAVSEAMLRSAGASNYGAVICLLPADHPKRAVDAGAILRSQRVDYMHLPVEYVHLPIEYAHLPVEYVEIPVDWLNPTQADLDQFTQTMDHLVAKGIKVHVHCALNMRVSAFCALYLFERGFMNRDQAQALINEVWGEPLEPAWSQLLADRGLPVRYEGTS